jgi:hypothetical protein
MSNNNDGALGADQRQGGGDMQIGRWFSMSSMVMSMAISLVGWQAGAQELHRVRGTLAEVDLPKLIMDSQEGGQLQASLNDATGIYVVTPGKRDDIQAGQFVGITSIGAAGDQRVALEVHIFADDLRGLGEGHYPWDPASEPTMMTNAAIAEIDSVDDGPLLTLTYSESHGEGDSKTTTEGQQQIMVPEDIPVVHFAKADRDVLTPGREAFMLMKDNEAGEPLLLGIVVGDGIAPPM